jgi:hypothetical protein
LQPFENFIRNIWIKIKVLLMEWPGRRKSSIAL